ncbi:hypothetical protein RDABS01_021630 [Bienertia sinuspersici]
MDQGVEMGKTLSSIIRCGKKLQITRAAQKLNKVKSSLKELNRIGFSNIQAEAVSAYQQLI